MTALFNKDGHGAEELNRLTGSYYASNKYENISAEIDFATNEVAGIVGKKIVERAGTEYQEGGDSALVALVQMPIACLAISRHFQQMGVSHEDAGRKLKIDENEKIPFEWMLDRDDRAMRERYYRSLDALYSYLEQEDIAEWQQSPVRKLLSGSIVRGLSSFEQVYPIEHSYYTYFMLQPLVIEAQNARLRKMLGEKWDRINSADVAEEDRLLLQYAQRVVILYAVITAVERWSIEVFPLSIARRFSPTYQGNRASQSASMQEIEWYLAKLRGQVADAETDLVAVLNGTENPYEDYPLMPENDRRKKYFNAGV